MSGTYAQKHAPSEIRLKRAEKILAVTFEDGRAFALPAEYLRVMSPSAEVQGHAPEQRQLVHGRAHVGILEVEPVGNYAVRLVFDDLHDSGLYTWDYLYELGDEQSERWAGYLAELTEAGKSREPERR
ncbi:MAG: DUF971 domain-containing protein [Rhodospirillales bacterium]|nr:DUF971 domain-containing protein [Rhodospirillales bacterium]